MRKKETNIKEKITKHALKIFSQKGFFRTTIDDIAQATGVAKGTIYLYFKDKQDLYIATIDEYFSQAIATLTAIQAKSITPSEKMEEIAVNFVDYIKQLKTSHMLFTFENINLKGKTLKQMHTVIEPQIHRMIEIISNIIRNGIRNNEFRKVDPKIAAFYFISTIRTIFLSDFYTSDVPFRTESVLKLFFEGLKRRR
ncbi:MAG: TetR/AcrR family transcriptional regulator [candidate division WOR-3 bacterium]|jgi:AcrR family transcriptional regulator